jgi:hypothetical protein
MFALTMGAGTNMAIGDVCKTPAPTGTLPIPYPNISTSAPTAPAAFNVLMGCTPTLNLSSKTLVSNGDEAGCMGGLVSSMIIGQTDYMVGAITVSAGGTPVQRLTSVTGQNSMGTTLNIVGMTAVPSQVTVLVLG